MVVKNTTVSRYFGSDKVRIIGPGPSPKHGIVPDNYVFNHKNDEKKCYF